TAVNAPTTTRFGSSSPTVPSLASRSTVPSFCGTAYTSSNEGTHHLTSTVGSPRFDAWHMRPADAGLLSPELAAGIRRVKGVRRIGVRLGNWLTPDQGRRVPWGITVATIPPGLSTANMCCTNIRSAFLPDSGDQP